MTSAAARSGASMGVPNQDRGHIVRGRSAGARRSAPAADVYGERRRNAAPQLCRSPEFDAKIAPMTSLSYLVRASLGCRPGWRPHGVAAGRPCVCPVAVWPECAGSDTDDEKNRKFQRTAQRAFDGRPCSRRRVLPGILHVHRVPGMFFASVISGGVSGSEGWCCQARTRRRSRARSRWRASRRRWRTSWPAQVARASARGCRSRCRHSSTPARSWRYASDLRPFNHPPARPTAPQSSPCRGFCDDLVTKACCSHSTGNLHRLSPLIIRQAFPYHTRKCNANPSTHAVKLPSSTRHTPSMSWATVAASQTQHSVFGGACRARWRRS